jgi:hypothetical protein
MNRREFITLLGGAAAWPVAARAQQQTAMAVVGFLRVTSASDSTHLVAAFQQGLKQTGFVDGQNVAMEAFLIGFARACRFSRSNLGLQSPPPFGRHRLLGRQALMRAK